MKALIKKWIETLNEIRGEIKRKKFLFSAEHFNLLNGLMKWLAKIFYCILLSIVHTLFIENDAKIFCAHYTWKVAEKGFKRVFMMNKLAMILTLVKLFLKNF